MGFRPGLSSGVWCFIALCAATFLAGSLYTTDTTHARSKLWPADLHYTYAGSDYPSSWPLPPLDLVHLSYEDSAHYSIDTPYGEAAWNATLPSGGHLVYLGPDRRAFTLAMFHEIRCLNILREVLVAFYADSTATDYDRPAIVKHCMNYLRQMVLCRADVRLESVRASSRSRKTVADVTHECRDWEAVYEAAERNYEEYINLNGRDDTVDTVA